MSMLPEPMQLAECTTVFRSMRARNNNNTNNNSNINNNTEDEGGSCSSSNSNGGGHRCRFAVEAPYVMSIRRHCADRIWQLCEDSKLRETTAHTATCYFDRILQTRSDRLPVRIEQLGLVCVRLAAKFDEREEDVPTLDRLLGRRASRREHEEARDAEVALANALEWQLYEVTSLHVVEHLNNCATGVIVDLHADSLSGASASAHDVAAFCASYTAFFANMCLQTPQFLPYDATRLASAVVLAMRNLLSITPKWPQRLQDLTQYSEFELEDISHMILTHYYAEFQDHAKSVSQFPRSSADSPKNVANYRDDDDHHHSDQQQHHRLAQQQQHQQQQEGHYRRGEDFNLAANEFTFPW